MNRHDIQQRLAAARPHGQDADDPELREAQAQAEAHDDLRAWLENERAFDRAFAAKLAEVPVPRNLKDRLLEQEHAQRSPVRPRPNTAPLLVLVAAFVLLGIAAVALFTDAGGLRAGGAMDLATFRQEAIQTFGPDFQLGHQAQDLAELRQWLAAHGGAGDMQVPPALAAKDGMGCAVVELGGHKASLICFQMADGQLAHLFAMPERAIADAPRQPVRSVADGWTTSAWSHDGMTYLLAVHSTRPEDLRQVFPDATTLGVGPLSERHAQDARVEGNPTRRQPASLPDIPLRALSLV